MKLLRFLFMALALLFLADRSAVAQCAMCSLNAENSVKNGNTQGRGLNDGILFLLAVPYLAIAGVGVLWYAKYRRPAGKGVLPSGNGKT